jgi:hypothetical protein
MHKTMAIAFLILAAGCSSSSTTPSGAGGTGGQAPHDGAADTVSPADGAGTFTLKIENYLSWCSVTEQGTDESSTALVTMTFPAGTVVDLNAMALSSTFVWGYWVGTAGDTTSAHDTSMSTTVTMTANKTVQACCPFAPTGGGLATPCPSPN